MYCTFVSADSAHAIVYANFVKIAMNFCISMDSNTCKCMYMFDTCSYMYA